MAIPDISHFSVAELEALKGSIDSVIGGRRQTEHESLYATFEEMAEAAGLTLEEVMQARVTKKRVVQPKYRNPNNPMQVWSGRGRKPSWVEAYTSTGGELSDCLI